MKPTRRVNVKLLALAAAIVPACSALAVPTTWTNSTFSRQWSNPSNWSNGEPNSGLDAIFPAGFPNGGIVITLVDEFCLSLTLNDSYTLSGGSLDIGAGGVTVDADKTATILSVLDGNDGLVKAGSGRLILSGGNTFTGPVLINAGTLNVNDDSRLGNASNDVTLDGGTLQVGSAFTANSGRTFTLGLGGGTFDISGDLTVDGVIDGTGLLTKTGAGSLILRGANTYTGGTTINDGTLALGTSDVLSDAGAVTISGGTLDVSIYSETVGPVTLVGGSITGTTGTLTGSSYDVQDGTISAALAGSAALTKSTAGTVTLSATNTYIGGTTINAGTLQIGNGGMTGSIVGDVTNNATLEFSHTGDQTLGGVISGPGNVSRTGNGRLILTGNNTYTGVTNIGAGIIQIGDGGTSGSIVGNVTNNGTLAFNRSDNLTYAGAIQGAGALNQDGTGTTVLTGNNTYTGTTTIGAGTLQIGDGGTTGGIISNVTNNGTLAFNRSDALTYAGVISGNGGVHQNGAGTTILSADNTYTGTTTINAGTLQLGDGGTSGSIVSNVTANGTLAFNRSDTLTYSGVISGTGAVHHDGTGTTVLTATNTFTGTTTVNAGILQIGNGGTTGSFAGNIVNNSFLVFDRSTAHTYAGALSGTGTTIVRGLGTLTLSGASPAYNGTIRTDGTITVNGALGGGGSLALDGTATLNANAAVNLSIHGNDVGTLIDVGGNVSLGSASSFLGFVHAGTLDAGGNSVTLNAAGYASLGGLTTLAGGAINAPNGLALRSGSNLLGNGSVNARVTGELGSVIEANDALALGDAASPAGFNFAGELRTRQHTVTLNSSAQASLGNLTTLGEGASPGTLNAANGVIVDFGDAITGYGTISSTNTLAKRTIVNGVAQGNSAGLPLTFGGYVKGVGSFDHVTFAGTFDPGLSPTLATVGSITFAPTGTLIMELGGTDRGSQYDAILASGTLGLGGTLQVALTNGFNPLVGQSFDIFDWGTLSGTFDFVNLPTLDGNLEWDVSDLYTTGVLAVAATNLPGDYNLDGTVDGADYVLWRKDPASFGGDPAGYITWRANFGNTAGSGATTSAVPEPLGLALSLLAAVALAQWRLRRG